ncbi:uncharacterized protein [Cicer arietinum]|uniref:Kinesin-like protein KIN-6 isoform X2 n=1 Tax=Cicer arietinum TaxID=3827 RepID=A0A1S2Y895_CICAR|nr:kinesin-like protein KIN-6 isoform X2 [Cicer arietinum]
MDNGTPKTGPNTVTIRRNPPRRARPTPQGITPFPHEEILSTQPLQSQNPSTSENENLKVFLRIRPIQPPDQAPRARAKSAWPKNPTKKITAVVNTSKKKSSTTCISINDSQSVTLSVPSDLHESKRVKSETYGGFSHVFPSDSSQFEVYERMVKPLVEDFLKGRSGMLAALGPSGSGKTHTVFGSPRDPGMVPRVLHHIFNETEPDGKHNSRSFYIAIFEIYSERGKAEKLFDLLPDGGELSMQQSTVRGLKEVLICNAEQAESLIAQAVIKRATAMTNTNSQSSRSQCIINIRDVPQKCIGVVNPKSNDAVLTIIDLAGAEREKRTGNQGTRLLESNFINNTLMVFGLCLRSLLEHQKNPKKQLQKHFQNSMLTRYLRDYLEGKKRMTLLLTAKSGEDDYLDTSHLLRQTSPYMQIKYNEVDPSHMVSKKRHHQASSIIDNAKQSPSLAHLKRMKLIREHTVENDEKGVEDCNTSKKDTSTVCKLDTSNSVSFKSESDSHVRNERSHIIMRNFARALWNVLKECNSKLTVADKELQSLKESIEHEKKKNLGLETQLDEFRASCTCCKGINVKTVTEDYSSVDPDHPHNLYQQEMFNAESSSEPRIGLSDKEHMLGTTCTDLDSEKSDREVSISSSKSEHDNVLKVEVVSKETYNAESSSQLRLEQSNDEHMLGTACTELDSEKSDRKISVSLLNLGCHNAFEVDVVSKILSETFDAQPLSDPRLYMSNEEPMLGSPRTHFDSEKSDREVSVSLSEPGHHNALEVDSMCKIPSETFPAESSTDPRIDQSDAEHMLGTTCTKLDSEKSDRELSVSSSKPRHHNALEDGAVGKTPCETFHSESSSKPRLDQSDEAHMLGSTCRVLDSEKSDWEVAVSLSKPRLHKPFEVDALRKIPNETFNAEASSEPRLNQLDEGHMLGAICTELVSERSDREVSVFSSKPEHHNALEVDAVNMIPNEACHAESSSEPRFDLSNEAPMPGPSCTLLNSEKSDSIVSGVSVSSSKPEDHKALGVDDVRNMPSELLVSSLSTKSDILDSSTAKDVSSTKIPSDLEVNNSCKPSRPKRTLMPSSSVLSRDLSTFDLIDESEKLKGNRNTRKLAAPDPKRSNGSISLLHMLQSRKSNLRL